MKAERKKGGKRKRALLKSFSIIGVINTVRSFPCVENMQQTEI
nr:MAG TPA: hypothetical protein [Caudoviricetes sp.]